MSCTLATPFFHQKPKKLKILKNFKNFDEKVMKKEQKNEKKLKKLCKNRIILTPFLAFLMVRVGIKF
jgi:hypothetical protein